MKLRKNILKILIFIFVLLININIKAEDSSIVTGTTYTLPSADVNALLKVKTYRGYGMDRQNLGIYMPAGSSFKIRTKQNVILTIDILNDDSETEKNVKVSKDWVTITAESDSVPFIRTLHSDSLDKVEYEITDKNGVQNLTIYKKGDNENEFLTNWRNNSQNFAVIEDDFVTFLVPREDIDKIINNGNYPFTSIENMLDWYDGVISRYNSYIGLEKNSKSNFDKDITMKYFFKANKHGVGALAYYPFNYVAATDSSIKSLFQKGWAALHEIGHGFQSYYTWSPQEGDIILSETENNIFAYYEHLKFISGDSDNFLFASQTQQHYLEGIIDRPGWEGIQQYENFNDMVQTGSADHAGHRLFVFTNLFDKIGMENVMPYTLKKYRNIIGNDEKITNVDLYGKYFSEASGYNVIPYLNYFKIYPSKEVEEEVYSNESPILYPVAQVFNDTTASSIATNLNLRGIYSVIDNNDVRNYISTNKINRDVKFKISTDNSKKLNHKKLYIKNSKNEIIRQEVLSGNEIVVKDLPVGMYYVEISSGSISNTNYILIPQTDSGKADLAPTGSSGNSQSNNVLTIDLNYNYNPNGDTEEQIVDVPNTGIVNSILIVIGMIFISAGIGLLVYKKEELR